LSRHSSPHEITSLQHATFDDPEHDHGAGDEVDELGYDPELEPDLEFALDLDPESERDAEPEPDPDDPYTRYADYDIDDQFDDQPRRSGPAKSSGPRLADVGRSGRVEVEIDDTPTDPDGPADGSPLSSYDVADHGPAPVPDWLVTDLNARDTPLGLMKTGKEADVSLLDRSVPGGPGCLLAVKVYRSSEHRMFHRDAGYVEGRRTRRSREMRAMAKRTQFGRELLSGRWAAAEFGALAELWAAGGRVPYPVQLIGSELMMEFIGDPDGSAAPRLAAYDSDTTEFTDLWHDLVATLELLAQSGRTHGDLSQYNILISDQGCVVIDLPQVVDLVGNPQGIGYLERDCRRVADFFARRGVLAADAEKLTEHLWFTATGSDVAPPVPVLPLPIISSEE
jgi:RIO kinase 1